MLYETNEMYTNRIVETDIIVELLKRTSPSKHTTSFQRCNNALSTSKQRRVLTGDLIELLRQTSLIEIDHRDTVRIISYWNTIMFIKENGYLLNPSSAKC